MTMIIIICSVDLESFSVGLVHANFSVNLAYVLGSPNPCKL